MILISTAQANHKKILNIENEFTTARWKQRGNAIINEVILIK